MTDFTLINGGNTRPPTAVEIIRLGCRTQLSFPEIDRRVVKAFPRMTVVEL
jgi:hypothetical protein